MGLYTLIIVVAGFIGQSQAKTLTLPDAVRIAVENSPQVQAATQAVKNSELEEKSAQMRFFPTFEAQSQLGIERYHTTTSGINYTSPSPWASKLGITMTESLYDNGQNWLQLKIAKKTRELAQFRLQKTRDQLVRDLAFEFYNFALQTKIAEIQQNQVNLIRKQFGNVSHAYQQGLKTGKDYLRLKTQVMRNDLDLANAKVELGKSKLELLRFLQQMHDQADDFDFVVSFKANDAFQIPMKAPDIDNHYEMLLSNTEKSVQDLRVESVRRRIGPEIYLTSTANYGSRNFLATGTTWNDNIGWEYNALLAVRYTFWDFGIRARNFQVAEGNRLIVERNLETGIIKTQNDIEKLMLDIQLRAKNLKLTDELLKLEQKNYTTIEGDYRIGKVQFLDLINGLRDLSSARLAYFSSLLALKRNLVDYRYHARDLYDWILHE